MKNLFEDLSKFQIKFRMKAKFVYEELRFNFDRNPTDRFRVKPGISREPVPNPRKRGYGGLSDREMEIISRHEDRIQQLKDEVYDIEAKIEDLQYDLEQLSSQEFTSGELEQFYSQVQEEFGFNALDILNSGMSREEKIKAIDRLNPSQDFGEEEFENLVRDYEYYHPDDADPEEMEKLENKISKLERQKMERENTIDKLETKIYNIETY